MNQKDMISQIKVLVCDHGPARIAGELGFRDSRSIVNWIKKEKIPMHKRHLVELYLESNWNGYNKGSNQEAV